MSDTSILSSSRREVTIAKPDHQSEINENTPNLVTSGKSQRVLIDGYCFSVEIYRLEAQRHWTLEVVGQDSTSHVWEEEFASDKDARNTALREIEDKGPVEFMRGSNVIPFIPR